MVEVGLISRFTLALTNPTISASVLIAGMLVFSGLGAFVSERLFDRARIALPVILLLVAVLLIGYGLFLSPVLDAIGAYPYALRLICLLCSDRAAGLPDGLPDGDRHDLADAAEEGPHVRLGLGHQWLLLGDRRGAGADHRHQFRPCRRARRGRRRLSRRHPGVLRRAASRPSRRCKAADMGGNAAFPTVIGTPRRKPCRFFGHRRLPTPPAPGGPLPQ